MSYQSDKEIEITRLKTLILDLTDGDFVHPKDVQRQTGYSLGKCAEMLKSIDEIRMQASRGKL